MHTTHTHLGARLHVQISGAADASALVLLHGGLGSAGDFAALLPHVQPVFRVIALDTRGHGRSTLGDAPPSDAQLADDAQHVLQQLGVARFSLLGFSDGGTTPYQLAAAHPGVQQLITVGVQ